MARGLRIVLACAVALAALGSAGCIRSRMVITTEPSGARVAVENEDRGNTPIDIPFIWYWHYKIDVEKEGYERLETFERFRTPPWFVFPLDLFWEVLPVPIPDVRKRHYVLKPLAQTAPSE